MKYKILHVLGTARAEGAGIVRIVTTLAAGLDRDKYRLYACFLNGDGPLVGELERAGVSVFSVDWSRGALDPIGAGRFWGAISGRRFAIAHIHFGGRSVQWLARSTGAVVIVHAHGFVSESDSNTSRLIRADGADAVVACSRAVAEKVVGTRVQVVYAGIPAADLAAARSTVEIPRNSRTVGAAGRLVPIKGFKYLIRAFAMVRREFPDCRLEIAGAGPEDTHLTDEISNLGLQKAAVLLGWQHELTSLFKRWDLYIQPSLKEGFPIAPLEAMVSGLPVVASKVGGLSEMIEDGITGWLVEPANAEALAGRIRWMLLRSEACTAMGHAAHARARKYFSDQRMVSEISQIYDGFIISEQTAGPQPEKLPSDTGTAEMSQCRIIR